MYGAADAHRGRHQHRLSGSLWPGKSRALLDAARAGELQLITTQVLLAELVDVLGRAKFAGRLERAGATVAALLAAYLDLVEVIVPAEITPTVAADPDDDAVLAAALAGHADLIVSGDAHLLNLKHFHHIRILTVREALALIAQLRT